MQHTKRLCLDPIPARLHVAACPMVLLPLGTRGGCCFGNAGLPRGFFAWNNSLPTASSLTRRRGRPCHPGPLPTCPLLVPVAEQTVAMGGSQCLTHAPGHPGEGPHTGPCQGMLQHLQPVSRTTSATLELLRAVPPICTHTPLWPFAPTSHMRPT